MSNINRYYQPSAPRYTSQFIEDRYPEELIMQAGAMKYQQGQQFAKDVGEIEGLVATMPYGYRSSELAFGKPANPETGEPAQEGVIKRWENRIKDYTTKFATSYDTPQAVQELSKLKTMFEGDRDRQLMLMDATQGNEDRNTQLRSTDTYHLDYDPNVSRQTGRIKQFRSGDPYAPYGNLIRYTDLAEQANKEFNVVPTDIRQVPILNEAGESVGTQRREFIDPRKMEPVIKSLAERAVKGESKEGAYMKTLFRDDRGNPRNPTYEEAYNYYKPLADKYMLERTNIDIDRTTGTGSATYSIGSSVIPNNYNKNSKKEINQIRLAQAFADQGNSLEVNSGLANILAMQSKTDKSATTGTQGQKARIIKRYIDDFGSKELNLDVKRFTDPKENDAASKTIFGIGTVNGKLSIDVIAPIFTGSVAYDADTGEQLSTDDKKDLIKAGKDGTEAEFVGMLSPEKSIMAPAPGMTLVSVGGKRVLMPGSKEYVERQKLDWNIYGYQRSSNKMGDVFQLDLTNGDITDVTDINREGDPTTLTEPNPFYIMPVEDYTHTDKYGQPKILVKVFAYNPTLGGGEDEQQQVNLLTSGMQDINTGVPGVGEQLGKIANIVGPKAKGASGDGILNNKNGFFIKEYDMADFMHLKDDKGNAVSPTKAILNQMLIERNELFQAKEDRLGSMLQ